MPIDFEQLALDGINQFGRIDSTLRSLEQSVQLIRSDNALLMQHIQEVKLAVNDINHRLNINTADHATIHGRIDEVKEELDAVKAIVADNQQNGCAAHAITAAQLKDITELMKQLEFAAKVFGYRVFGVPVWMILIGMIFLGFVIDILAHTDLTLRLLGR